MKQINLNLNLTYRDTSISISHMNCYISKHTRVIKFINLIQKQVYIKRTKCFM
ncbi:unnamed protein product [Schistosoma curassoni]|uniref:Uncharacterized protein n=1 Tax=Schistosoma curassoni TaxID=6186 RepID=A0A183KG55_9TREM|nr:unnamed protein product [Schistosoma curassoni]